MTTDEFNENEVIDFLSRSRLESILNISNQIQNLALKDINFRKEIQKKLFIQKFTKKISQFYKDIKEEKASSNKKN